MTRVTAEQLDALYEYIEQHRDEVEQEYKRILQCEAVARAEAEQIRRERTPDLFDISPEELRRRLLQKMEEKKKAMQSQNRNHAFH